MVGVGEQGPRSGRRALAALGALILGTAADASAVAQDDEPPIRLTYHAAEGCPDQADFLARVRLRTPRASLAPVGTSEHEGRGFAVDIDAGSPAFGRVAIGDPEHPEGARRVRAETCEEVADALALVVALAIDPRASEPPSMVPSAGAVGFSPPADPAPPAVASAVAEPVVAVSPPPATRRPAKETLPPRSREGTSGHRVLLVGLDLAGDAGVSPAVLPGVSAYVGWEPKGTALFTPSLRVALHRAESGTIAVPTGTAAFTLTAARLDACPLALRIGRTLSVKAGARIEAGTLDVSGDDAVAARKVVRAWLAAGALARAEWTFLDPLFLNLDASADVRMTRDQFFFLPDTNVYRVPLVGAGVGAGFGAHFL